MTLLDRFTTRRRPSVLERIAPFPAPLVTALALSWRLAPDHYSCGIPIAITADSAYSPIGFDVQLMKKLIAELMNVDIGIIGEQGFGKTLFGSLLAETILSLDPGPQRENSLRYDSIKLNDNVPEAKGLVVDVLQGEIIDPHKISINWPSEKSGLTLGETQRLGIRMFEVANERRATQHERKILRRAIEIIRAQPDTDPTKLCRVLDQYPEGFTNGAWGNLEAYAIDQMKHAALELKLTFENFLGEDYLGMFGGQGIDLFDVLDRKVVSFDLKEIGNAQIRSVLLVVLNAIESAAMLPKDPAHPELGMRNPKWVPMITIVDESYEGWDNEQFAMEGYSKAKTNRSGSRVRITIFHRFTDLTEAISNPKSLKLARNAMNEIKIWIIFRQVEAGLPEIKRLLPTIPDNMLRGMLSYEQGEFLLVIPGQAPRLCVAKPIAQDLRTYNTEGANLSTLSRFLKSGNPRKLLGYRDPRFAQTEVG